MKTPTEMAIDRLNSLSVFDNRLYNARLMVDDLESVRFDHTGAFDELEREIDKALEYLFQEIKEMEEYK
jgi:hypothetical protein